VVALRCIAGPKEFHPGEMTLEALKVINDRTVSARAATGDAQSITACTLMQRLRCSGGPARGTECGGTIQSNTASKNQ